MYKKKVLIISYYWPPSGGAGVQRWLKFSKFLPQYGIEPYIITVDEKYAAYPKIDRSLEEAVLPNLKVFKTKSFEILNLANKTTRKEMPYGGFTNVNKQSLWMLVSRFLRGNFFLPDARRGWNKYAYRKAKEVISKYNIDTLITTSPPHSVQLVGLRLKQKLKIRWIADLRDPWSDIYYNKDLFRTKIADYFDKKKERKILENADELITICTSVKNLFSEKTKKLKSDNFHIILNGFDNDDFVRFPEEKFDEFILSYVGTIAASYKPEAVFKAYKNVIEKNRDVHFKLRFVGSVPDEIKKLLHEIGLSEYCEFTGYLPHNQAVEYMKQSSALLSIFPKTADYDGVPGKFAEYIAARKPIISLATKTGDAAKILQKTEAGKTFGENEQKEIEIFLEELILKHRKKIPLRRENTMERQKISRKYGTAQLAKIIKQTDKL